MQTSIDITSKAGASIDPNNEIDKKSVKEVKNKIDSEKIKDIIAKKKKKEKKKNEKKEGAGGGGGGGDGGDGGDGGKGGEDPPNPKDYDMDSIKKEKTDTNIPSFID